MGRTKVSVMRNKATICNIWTVQHEEMVLKRLKLLGSETVKQDCKKAGTTSCLLNDAAVHRFKAVIRMVSIRFGLARIINGLDLLGLNLLQFTTALFSAGSR